MKKLEISQMENLQGAKYCTKEAAGVVLGFVTLTASVATLNPFGIVTGAAGLYLTLDAIDNGSCTSW